MSIGAQMISLVKKGSTIQSFVFLASSVYSTPLLLNLSLPKVHYNVFGKEKKMFKNEVFGTKFSILVAF